MAFGTSRDRRTNRRHAVPIEGPGKVGKSLFDGFQRAYWFKKHIELLLAPLIDRTQASGGSVKVGVHLTANA
jgi:hypothetical protein